MNDILRLIKNAGVILLISAGLFVGTLTLAQQADDPANCLAAAEDEGDGTGSRDGNPNLEDSSFTDLS